MTLSIYVENRQNGWRNTLRALRVPFPLQWGRFLRGGDGEQIWKSVLKRTQNYCVDLLALYLRQMIIKIHYSNKVVNLPCAVAAETMPFHVPTGKASARCNILYLHVKSLSF